jgi:hypothetical protein
LTTTLHWPPEALTSMSPGHVSVQDSWAQLENSDVLPAESVAVAVMASPGLSVTGKLKEKLLPQPVPV